MKVDIFKRDGLNFAPRTFLMGNGATIVARFLPTAASQDTSTHNIVSVHDFSHTSAGASAPWRRLALKRSWEAIYCVCRPTHSTYVSYSISPDHGTLQTALVPSSATKTIACVLDTHLGGVLCLENVCTMLTHSMSDVLLTSGRHSKWPIGARGCAS
jgi:hypothetical protein